MPKSDPIRRALLPLAVLAVAAAVTLWPTPVVSADPPPASQPATAAVGPIAYYVDKCARCHGDISAAYHGVTNPQKGEQLKKTIDDMAYGPAQSPIEGDPLQWQTDLHEAMFGKTPYVWVDSSDTAKLSGEVLPGTTLTLEPAGPIKIDGTRFEAPRGKGTLVATRGGKTVRVPVGP